MRALLFLPLAIASVASLSCPPDYKFQKGIGCVRILYEKVVDTIENLLPKARIECAKDRAHLPIIRNKETDDYFNDFINSRPNPAAEWMVLDLSCSSTTRRLEWVDGTNATFPDYFDNEFDCVSKGETYASQPIMPGWFKAPISETRYYTVLCVNDGAEVMTSPTIPPSTTPKISCPENYQMQDTIGCVRVLYDKVVDTVDNLLYKSREECAKDGAHLPIIRDKEMDDKFNEFINSFPTHGAEWMVLDLTCNSTSHRLEWVDGTSPTFPQYFDDDFDCVETGETYASQPIMPGWFKAPTSDWRYYTVLCINDGSEIITVQPTITTSSPLCPPNYQLEDGIGCARVLFDNVYDKADTLLYNARIECAKDGAHLPVIKNQQEDDHFNQFVNNTIGFHADTYLILDMVCNASTRSLQWVDGSPINYPQSLIYPNNLLNFDCAYMENIFASKPREQKWYSIHTPWEEPSTVMCVFDVDEVATERPSLTVTSTAPAVRTTADVSSLPACPQDAPKTGEEILPPGYPDSVVPCQYFLFVDENAKVELEILNLHTAVDGEYLEIFEGPTGSNLIANLTGTIAAPAKFATAASNVMRVSWNPNGAGFGEGFKIRYNQVGGVATSSSGSVIDKTTTRAAGALTVLPLVSLCIAMMNFLM